LSLAGCCSGTCLREKCEAGPGEQCSQPSDCTTQNCVDGGCANCGLGGGLCNNASDCCNGFGCASEFVEGLVTTKGVPIDGGTVCCASPGSSCVSGQNPCCGDCEQGSCACEKPTQLCIFDQSCCAGEACMIQGGGQGFLACCQLDAQSCFSDAECCSGNCLSASTCACVPDGGRCGAAGDIAPQGPAACCSGQCDKGTCL
jgi:hypothetical protein